MYTKATKKMGIWRHSHNSASSFRPVPTQGLVLALGAMAFFTWLVFFLVLKIRGDFFLIESSPVELLKAPSKGGYFFESRRAALAVAILPAPQGKLRFLFDTGESFVMPGKDMELTRFVAKRADAIELMAMLTMVPRNAAARVHIWPDRRLHFADLDKAIKILSRLGFDDFDIAVDGG